MSVYLIAIRVKGKRLAKATFAGLALGVTLSVAEGVSMGEVR